MTSWQVHKCKYYDYRRMFYHGRGSWECGILSLYFVHFVNRVYLSAAAIRARRYLNRRLLGMILEDEAVVAMCACIVYDK